MVRATVLKVDDHAVEGVPTDKTKAKGEKMVLEPPMNSAQRRKLGDITNVLKRNILMNHGANQHQQSTLLSSAEYAEKLQKENMRLMKVIMERNAIIERSGYELQKFRINLQKVQEQNLQLAQTNTRILAEINTSKEQLKTLQHELSCKNGILMARKLLLESQNLPCTHHQASENKDRANASSRACETFHPNGEDHKTASESSNGNALQINEKANNKRVYGRISPANSEALDIIGRPGESVQTTNIRRVSLRRQSRRFNIQEMGVTENLNGIHDDQESAAKAGCSASDLSIGSKPEAVDLHDTKEIIGKSRVSSRRQQEELNRELKNRTRGGEAEEMRKTSVGRPSRQAAGKIKSYKEVSLKQKMRRDF